MSYTGKYSHGGYSYNVTLEEPDGGRLSFLVESNAPSDKLEAYRDSFAERMTGEFGGPENVDWVEKRGDFYQQVKFSNRQERMLNPNVDISRDDMESALKAGDLKPELRVSFEKNIVEVPKEQVAQTFESERHWTEQLVPPQMNPSPDR